MANQDVATKADIEKVIQSTKADIEKVIQSTKADIEKVIQSTKEDIDKVIRASKADIESVILLMQQLTHQLEGKVDRGFESVDRRLEVMEKRLDRMGDSMVYFQHQTGALMRWSEGVDRSQTSITGTQAAQQKAIDKLNDRVTRLEQDNEQRNQN